MPDEYDKARRWWQFRLGTMCLTVAVICASLGWWSERRRLRAEIETLERELALQQFNSTIRSGGFLERIDAVRSAADNPAVESGPGLIHALTDPDPRIVMLARDGLRRLSGKPSGLGFPDSPRQNPTQATEAWQNWMDWYVAKRQEQEPDYSLPDWCTWQPAQWSGYDVQDTTNQGVDTSTLDDLFGTSPSAVDLFGDAFRDEETKGNR